MARTSPQLTLKQENGATVDLSSLIIEKDVLESQDYLKKLLDSPQPSPDVDKQCTAGVIGAAQKVVGWIKIPCSEILYAGFFCGPRSESIQIESGENGTNPTCPSGWIQYNNKICFSVLGLKTHSVAASEISQLCSEKGGRPVYLDIANYIHKHESLLEKVYNCHALSISSACKGKFVGSFVMSFNTILRLVDIAKFNYSYTLDEVLDKVFYEGVVIWGFLKWDNSFTFDPFNFWTDVFSMQFLTTESLPVAFSEDGKCGVLSWVDGKIIWYPQNCNQPMVADYIICETDTQILTSRCSPTSQFTCHDGSCIITQRVCDKRDDCIDSSDEIGCQKQSTEEQNPKCSSHEFQCWPSEFCIGAHLLCDSFTDCPDGSDEMYCSKDVCREYEYMCPGGKCISQEKICDGVIHCNDRRDETSCQGEFSCQGFLCLSGTCIPLTKQLDFIPDCELGEDELPIDRNESMSFDVSRNPWCFVDDDGFASASCRLLDVEQREPCFRINDICILQTLEHADNTGCTNAAHLSHCKDVYCPVGMFKCPGRYCIPFYMVCDGINHCQYGEDEVGCSRMSCPGMLKCAKEQICVPQQHICDGSPQCHQSRDDETLCGQCPDGCDCRGYSIECNYFSLVGLNSTTFSATALTLSNVGELLDISKLDYIRNIVYFHLTGTSLVGLVSPYEKFWKFQIDLRYMSLRNNHLKNVGDGTFSGLDNLHFLDLSNNRLHNLPEKMFWPLLQLQVLLLQNNAIQKLERTHFRFLSKLESLNVIGNDLIYIESMTFHNLLQLRFVWSDTPRICCLVPSSVTCSAPEYLISTCEGLLGATSQRVFIWLLGLLGALANSFLLLKHGLRGRSIKQLSSNDKSYNVLITNMALSDVLMNVNLLTLGAMDIKFMGTFYRHVDEWRTRFGCKFLGVMSLVSLESTLYTLFLMALMRTAAVLYPIDFRQSQGKQGKIVKACLLGWLLAVCIATVPLYSYSQLTGSASVMPNGLCVLLDFSQSNRETTFLSVFVSVNGVIIIGISACYFCIFRKLFCSSSNATGASAKNARKAQDAKVAGKIFLVVMADMLTWLPILICISLSLVHVSLPNELMTWIVVLVLPINSALNPFLYSLETIRGVLSGCLRRHT